MWMVLPQIRSMHRIPALLAVVALAGLGAGCLRDPNARKQNYFDSGQRYFEKGDYRAASIQYQNALTIDSQFVEAHYRLGMAYGELARWREAYRELAAAIELQPSHKEARLALAHLYLLDRQTREARTEAEAVQALDPNNVRAQNLMGQIYLAENDLPQAIAEFEKAQQLAPKESILWISSGFARVVAKQYPAAEKDFRHALELDRSSIEAYRNLVNLFQLTGRDREVEPLLRQALESNPHSLDLHLVLADSYLRQGRAKEIDEIFTGMKNRSADFPPDLRLTLGDFWMWHNELSRAVEEFQAIESAQSSVVAKKKLISALMTLGRLDESERLNQQILAANPKDFEGRLFEGALRHLRGDSASAVTLLRKALKDEPQSAFGHYYLGLALLRQAKPDEAESEFLECIHLNENFGYAFLNLAQIRLQRRDWKATVEYAGKVTALMPNSPDGYLLLSQAYVSKGEPQRAEQILVQIAKKMALDSTAMHELLGAAYVAQGKTAAGLQEYEKAWARLQDPIESVNRFADVLVARGQTELALRQVRELNARQPQPGYLELLAHLYLLKGDLNAAEAACQQALSLDSSRWVAHLHLGTVYDRLHRPEESVSHYDQVTKRQPQVIPAYVFAADVRLRQGKFDQASAYLEAAQKVESGSPLVQLALARLWAEQGEKLLEATALVQGLQQKTPDDPYLSDTLAWIYYQKGLYSSGQMLLKRCIEQQPKNALFHYHLGMTYSKLGQQAQGRRELEAALRLGLNSTLWETAARQTLTAPRAQTQ